MGALDGRSVGRYRILDFLGSGAMGEVYLAEDPQIERKLAIKTVRLVGRPQEIEDRKRRLLREARAAGRLLHPNVVTLFDAGEEEGLLFLAFELIEGTDLAGRLENGPPLSLRDVLRIIRQVADALDFAHRQGIVHRDIKPSNILIDRQGRVKVADFGIAKVTGQSTELTVAGSVMGSPQYLSPEQIRGEELDGRSDIFSLGVVLYELLSKQRPFDGDTITTLVYQILHKEPPPISELRAIPERLEKLLRCMLAKSRDDRYATAAEVSTEVQAIERELADETLAAPAANLPMQETRVLPRRPSDGVPPVPPPAPQALGGTPPPPPRIASGPAPVPSTPPVTPAVSAAVAPQPAARQGYGARIAVAILLVLVLMASVAGGAIWWFFFRDKGADVAQMGSTPVPETPAPESAASTAAAETPAPSSMPASSPVPPPGEPRPVTAPAQSPAQQQPPVRTEPQQQRPAPPTPSTPSNTEPRTQPAAPPLPVPNTQHPLNPSQAPAPAPMPETERPSRRPPAPENNDDEEAPRRDDFAPDSVLPTGLQVVFRTTPPDAFVLVDGSVIGRASEWSGLKGARTYSLSAGEHQIKIRSEGLKDYRLLVKAGETSGVTPITTRLRPLAAAQADATDLKVYRVREAVGFKVDPPNATILVDGQPAGAASSYAGRLMQSSSWLSLPPGRHRIGITAPGRARQDVVVDVTPGAEKNKDRIEISLPSGGSE